MNANVEALPDPIRLNVVSDASGRHLGFQSFSTFTTWVISRA